MSSIHSGGVGTPGVPGPEAEIRRLRRRVLELEETNRSLHERNQGHVAREAEAVDIASALRVRVDELAREIHKQTFVDGEYDRQTLEAQVKELAEEAAAAPLLRLTLQETRAKLEGMSHERAEHARMVSALEAQVAQLTRERDEARRTKGGKR
jgi:hypothetical protein